MSNAPVGHARDYVAALTGLRGIAALFVFLFHYGSFNPGIRLDQKIPLIGSVLQFPLGLGWAGVDLFFVLSGFLLTLPFAYAILHGERPPPLAHYYRRRLLRVFPAYYFQLALILLGGSWFLAYRELDGIATLAHLTMAFDVGPEPVRPMNLVWWTLPVELSFYLLLPWIASFLKPRRWLVFLPLVVLMSVVYRFWAAGHFAGDRPDAVVYAASHIPGSLPEFLMGASAALLVHWLDSRGIRKPRPLALDLMLLAGLLSAGLWLWFVVLENGIVYWRGHWSMVVGPVALGLMLTLTVASLYWGSRLGRALFANPVVYFLGLISYSLYLWHFIVLQQAPKLFPETFGKLTGVPRFGVTLVLVVLVSAISYYLFERPFFRLRGRRQTTAPSAVSAGA
jgi:peptidoglycan/LPS O-acetylase OafA/YrhL